MINIGILGAGKISHRFMLGMKDVENAIIYSVAKRNIDEAAEYAKLYNIEKFYGYVDLYNDKNVDAVYIATPPFCHYEQIMECLKHGKHVICEKPLMKNSSDAKKCFDYANENNLILMEANKTIFTPTFQQIKSWCDNGEIGKIKYIEASYCYDGKFDDDHWVKQENLAGGGMYDVGVYPLSAVLYLMNSEIIESKKIVIKSDNCNDFEQYLIKFENGVVASVRGAINISTKNTLNIYGDLGYIECDNFWKSKKCKLIKVDNVIENEFEFNSEFTFQINDFLKSIECNCNQHLMSEKLTLDILKLIENKG